MIFKKIENIFLITLTYLLVLISYLLKNGIATDETKLREAFSEFGSVTDVFLPTDRDTGRQRGFGFVTFASRSDAQFAISKMEGAELDGRTIRVSESKPRGEGPASGSAGGRGGGGGGFNSSNRPEVKLYIGGLSFDSTEESVRSFFEQYGSVTDCFLPTDRDTGKLRGFAFVTMPSADAETAVRKADGAELDGRNIKVNEAQPKGSSGGGNSSRGGKFSDNSGGYGDYRAGGRGGGGGGRYNNDSYNRGNGSRGGGGGSYGYDDSRGSRGGYDGGYSGRGGRY